MQLPELQRYPRFGYDTETTGLQYPIDKAFGVSIGLPDGKKFYWDIRREPKIVEWLTESLRGYKGRIICHNSKFDYMMSYAAGIILPIEQMDCTVTRATLINEHISTIFPWSKNKKPDSYGLDSLAARYLGMRKHNEVYEDLAKLFGGAPTRKAQILNLQRAPARVVAPYAEDDAILALRLWEWQEDAINHQEIQEIVEFERKLTPTLIRTSMRGIDVDTGYAAEAMHKLTHVIDRKQEELSKSAGWDINTNSAPQIRKLFEPEYVDGEWRAKDGTSLPTTGTGAPSIGSESLRAMTDPNAMRVVELRSLLKTRDTFLAKHIIGHAINGKVYPNINQNKGEDGGTGTGRLSITSPAMQQIPSRNKEVAAIVKPAFLPPEGMVWVDTDLNSFEVRIFAHLVALYDKTIQEAYSRNPELDFHQYVADLTNLPRNAQYSGQANAKQLNLSMIFNSGNGAIADKMGMEWKWEQFTSKEGDVIRYKKAGIEAMQVIEKYHRKMGGVKVLAEKAKYYAEHRGYVKTQEGRRLRFPNGYKSYKASGLLIQATAADENKRNWMTIEDALGSDGHLILNTHDSYSMAIAEDWKPAHKRVKDAIEGQTHLRVPLILDFNGVGSNWWEALQK